MRTQEIKPDGVYVVKLSERDSVIYGGCEAEARVIRAGFHYTVERTRASRVRGAPFHDRRESEYPTGVEIEWDAQDVRSNRRGWDTEKLHPGRAIINARQVLQEAVAVER